MIHTTNRGQDLVRRLKSAFPVNEITLRTWSITLIIFWGSVFLGEIYRNEIQSRITTGAAPINKGSLATVKLRPYVRPPSLPVNSPQLFNAFLHVGLNNIRLCTIILVKGNLLFFLPVADLVTQGTRLGMIISVNGFPGTWFLILPHALIEIPAFLLVSAASMQAGSKIFFAPWTKKKDIFLGQLSFNIRILGLGIALMLVAASLEAYGRNSLWSS